MPSGLLKFFARFQSRFPELGVVAIASLAVTGLVLGFRHLGSLQPLELDAYDRLMQSRPQQAPDQRILVVGITEADIQKIGQFPIPDATLTQLLQKLLTYQPRVVGLDLLRGDIQVQPGASSDPEADRRALIEQLKQSDRLIAITFLGDAQSQSVPPPPGLSPDQVGFNDVAVDTGGVLRRNWMYDAEYPSLALRLALRYLRDDGIQDQPSQADPNVLQLGATAFAPLRSREGGYVGLNPNAYQILLNYRAARQAIPTVSLFEVLEDRVDPALIRNRIVLIGTTATSGKDFFLTPYSSGSSREQQMPGVIIHAQMVSQFLDAANGIRPLITTWSDLEESLWIWLWSLIGGLMAWALRRPLGLAAGSAASLVVLYSLCRWLFLQSVWVPLVPAFFTLLGTGGSVITYRAQQAQRQQQMVMRLLGQSSSPEIAETLWQRRDELLEGGKLSGQELTATLLFTDLKGFSTISEQLPPAQLLNWLNDYFEVMTEIVHEHHGVINKFTGDGVMAVFGVPIPREDREQIARDAYNAVASALKMGERLEQLNQQWQKMGLPEVKMRAGVFTGSVIVGSLGSKSRLEYGVIGDGVNTASRLESLDKDRQPSPCRILIAQETLNHLQDRFEVEAWGALTLKGKLEKVEVYRVLGTAQKSGSSPRMGADQ